jgi:uncharacterized protein (TIGR03067 family)
VTGASAETDQQKLQGKWNIESFEYNGNPVEFMKEAVREFKDARYSLIPKMGDMIEGSIKLDADKKPKEIDLEVNGRTLKGIYDLDGDVLKLSYSLTGGERPTEFISKADSGTTLIIHKRAK